MYFIVYKTTNQINGMYYIGCHKTKNLDDGYLGSGVLLQKEIEKFGFSNFKREILALCSSKEEMYEKEQQIVDENVVNDQKCYNLKTGGHGGFDWINENVSPEKKQIHEARGIHIQKFKNDPEYRQKCLQSVEQAKLSKTWKHKQTISRQKYYETHNGHFKGKSHTDVTKNKIRTSMLGRHTGEKNSQYGTCWVYSPTEKRNLKIKKEALESFLNQGWVKGRKTKY